MSYKDLNIKRSYISCGEENIAKSFLVPMLKQAKTYRRSVGFFSSGVFGPIIDGIVAVSYTHLMCIRDRSCSAHIFGSNQRLFLSRSRLRCHCSNSLMTVSQTCLSV